MKYVLIVVVFVVLSCKTGKNNQRIDPTCLQETVDKILSEPPSKYLTTIRQAIFEGERIFIYGEGQNTKKPIIVLNSNCEYLCEFGDGTGISNCPEGIYSAIKNSEIIWIDER